MAVEQLAKLTIEVEGGQEIEALFNPNQLTIQRRSVWRSTDTAKSDVPRSHFNRGEPATVSMELFFDTYEAGTDVREHTNEIFHLTTVEKHGDLHRPPLCKLGWGTFGLEDDWVLQSLSQSFTLFLGNGTPVRATLGCSFRQWRSDEIDNRKKQEASSDVAKLRTVRQGDRLSSIAAEEYKDPGMWRPIAEANGLDNPRILMPGDTLSIPRLPSTAARRR